MRTANRVVALKPSELVVRQLHINAFLTYAQERFGNIDVHDREHAEEVDLLLSHFPKMSRAEADRKVIEQERKMAAELDVIAIEDEVAMEARRDLLRRLDYGVPMAQAILENRGYMRKCPTPGRPSVWSDICDSIHPRD